MRYGPNDKFWIVTDPKPESTLADVLFETTLRGLQRQFAGGLTIDENPTIFTDYDEAKTDANNRMVAMRISRVVVSEQGKAKLEDVRRIELHDGDGNVMFGAELPDKPD